MDEHLELAIIAYDAYRKAIGIDCVSWQFLLEETKAAWIAAAREVNTYILENLNG